MTMRQPAADATELSPAKHFRSVAMIPESSGSKSSWLCLWDANRSCFDFVTAERRGNESFRNAIHRKVLESLDLTNRDVLVSNMAQLNLEFVDTLPESNGNSHVAVSFYMVHLYTQAARIAARELMESCWLNGKELLQGETTDGRPISPTLSYLLRRADVIKAW